LFSNRKKTIELVVIENGRSDLDGKLEGWFGDMPLFSMAEFRRDPVNYIPKKISFLLEKF
jgi:hypothetical protein